MVQINSKEYIKGSGSFLLIYDYGEYGDYSVSSERFQNKDSLLDRVNDLNTSTEKYGILFSGEIRDEIFFEIEQVVTKYKFSTK
jgi:hypothetical protein